MNDDGWCLELAEIHSRLLFTRSHTCQVRRSMDGDGEEDARTLIILLFR